MFMLSMADTLQLLSLTVGGVQNFIGLKLMCFQDRCPPHLESDWKQHQFSHPK